MTRLSGLRGPADAGPGGVAETADTAPSGPSEPLHDDGEASSCRSEELTSELPQLPQRPEDEPLLQEVPQHVRYFREEVANHGDEAEEELGEPQTHPEGQDGHDDEAEEAEEGSEQVQGREDDFVHC